MSMPADVLVIDDNLDLRDMVSEILAENGYAVASAGNGEEAIAWLAENDAPALVLLDWMMPVCDGACFRQRQKADPKLAKIPVVIVTAAPAERVANDVEACLRKPFDMDSLLAVVSRYVPPRP